MGPGLSASLVDRGGRGQTGRYFFSGPPARLAVLAACRAGAPTHFPAS